MGGVAYTKGLDIDSDHKEIHICTNYISQVPETRMKEEIQGVIIHEMVHCWQHNALGSAPGGLIEGIADWVRLKAGFAAPHWRRRADSDWDVGYERTAYFLEWLETEHGEDIVRKINEALRGCIYESDGIWEKCCGTSIEKLWKAYQSSLADEEAAEKAEKAEKGEEKEEKTRKRKLGVRGGRTSTSTTNTPNPTSGSGEDPRSACVKARRGGRMHVPIRGGPGS